jgi:hypothetical protein
MKRPHSGDDTCMNKTSQTTPAEAPSPTAEESTALAPESPVVLPLQAELRDKLRNFPAPQVQFRALIKTVPGLTA